VWPLYARETGTMTGYHSAPVLAEAHAKGFKGIDFEAAWPSFRKRAMDDDYRGLKFYRDLGFIPADKIDESVSKTLDPNTVIFDWCFLRHPLDRLQSLYSYFQRIDSADPLCRLARQEPARIFFKKLVESAPHLVSNVQVTFLANGGAFTRPADTPDVEIAADIFAKMAIPGLVEKFDESLVAAEYFLKPAFPRLKLDYSPKNVSRPLGPSSVDRQEWLKHSWGSDLYATLVQLNQCDLDLCRRAEAEVARRLNLIPSAAQRLANFRSRCPQPQVAAAYPRVHIA